MHTIEVAVGVWGINQDPFDEIFLKACLLKCNKTQIYGNPPWIFHNIMDPLPYTSFLEKDPTTSPLDFQPLWG